MKTQLIILEDFNIIVSDEEIKKGDYYIIKDLKTILFCTNKFLGLIYGENDYGRQSKGLKKIIASTNEKHNLPSINYNRLEEKFGIVNVEKLIYGCFGKEEWNDIHINAKRSLIEIFKTAQSLNDKKFSLNDLVKATKYASEITNNKLIYIDHFNKYIQQPRTFDIEIEMKEYGEELGCDPAYYGLPSHRPKITNNQIKIIKVKQ